MVVRELDHFQYRKMRKLMYLDEQQPLSFSYDSASATSYDTSTPEVNTTSKLASKSCALDIFEVFYF